MTATAPTSPVIFWNWTTRQVENKKGEIEDKDIPFMRYYTVFNLSQIEGLKLPENEEKKFDQILPCEQVIGSMPAAPTIEHGFSQACYDTAKDAVRMPPTSEG